MIKVNNVGMCSGCHACTSVCPKKCISMKRDKEGFLYPKVDNTLCIECGLCEEVCQCINPICTQNNPKFYACYNLDENIRMQSSSGGIFTLLAEEIINRGGVVFGAAFDDELFVRHMSIDKKEDLHKLRGSKYLQSTIGDSFVEAKKMLDLGRYVLFTGTPCQIDGLLHYLRKPYDNLYTQDIICHGAPSPTVWQKYLEYQEVVFNKRIDRTVLPTFRSKHGSWKKYSVVLHFVTGEEYCETFDKDLYMKAFLKDLSLRPSCYECHSKSLNRNSDITLADFWGVENVVPEMFDDKGTSLVFVNTEKGKEFFDCIKEHIDYKNVAIDEALAKNPSAYKSVEKPIKRRYFVNKFKQIDFERLVSNSTKVSFIRKIIRKVRKVFNKKSI